jgi:hypothetical protein
MAYGASMNSDTWNRCAVCGRFIPFADFGNGASRVLLYTESDRTHETWENLCKKHNSPAPVSPGVYAGDEAGGAVCAAPPVEGRE